MFDGSSRQRSGMVFQRKNRKGAFWEDCYHATIVQTNRHLLSCMTYIDLNMVRAGVVDYPSEWAECGYNEILNQPRRYSLIDRKRLKTILGVADGEDLFDAYQMALTSKRPAPGLLHHSDRGSQYCSRDYVSLLSRYGIKISMSRKGNCYDNAPMESFWGILKSELVHHFRFATRREAIQAITEYIVMFYNRQRRQARLNYLSPAAFEQMYYEKQREEILLAA